MRAFVFCFIVVNLIFSQRSPAAIYDTAGNKVADSSADKIPLNWRNFKADNKDGISGVGVLGDYWVGDICTASFIDTGVDSGPAYILTNAHCNYFAHYGFDFLKPNEFRVDKSTNYHVTFKHYMGTPPSERKKFGLKQIAYITESTTDVAIFEVEATQQELIAQGIRPLKLSKLPPQIGDKVQLIGVPLLYVQDSEKSLHTSDCTLLRTVSLKNGSCIAPDSVAHQCDSLPGFSGGPLVSYKTKEIVLLNSHGAADDSAKDADCTYETRPCEISSTSAQVVRPEFSYGQRVDTIAGCFDKKGLFNLNLGTCHLPK